MRFVSGICLALGLVPGPDQLSILEGRVGQDRGSPSSSRSVMRQPGHTQATWPAACKGLGPSCIGAVWTPLLGENRSMRIMELLMQRGWGAPHPGHALRLQQAPPWPLLLPICLLSIEAQLTSCLAPLTQMGP